MNTSFISLQGNESTGWDVIRRTFPIVSKENLSLSISTHSLRMHYSNKDKAEKAARKLAKEYLLSYAPPETNVITIACVHNQYLVATLTTKDGVIYQGSLMSTFMEALIKAVNQALYNNLLFLPPR